MWSKIWTWVKGNKKKVAGAVAFVAGAVATAATDGTVVDRIAKAIALAFTP